MCVVVTGQRVFVPRIRAEVFREIGRRIGALRLHVDDARDQYRVGTHSVCGCDQRVGRQLARGAHGVEARLGARACGAQRARDGVLELTANADVLVDSDDEDLRHGPLERRVFVDLHDLVAGRRRRDKQSEQHDADAVSSNHRDFDFAAIIFIWSPTRPVAGMGRRANGAPSAQLAATSLGSRNEPGTMLAKLLAMSEQARLA